MINVELIMLQNERAALEREGKTMPDYCCIAEKICNPRYNEKK